MNPDSLALIKKSEESLDVALELHRGGHYDFAVGRAYYAMFYLAEAALLEKGQAFSSHRAIHSGFYHQFIETEILDKNIHQSFVRGFELRQAGDYGGLASVTREQSEDLNNRASDFVQMVKFVIFNVRHNDA